MINSLFLFFVCRSNPSNSNEAILVWGDTGGSVNALHFNSASIALFERPPAPAGEKQGNTYYCALYTPS